MKKIYLASHSKARRKLLALLGVRFQVKPSGVVEKTSASGKSFSALVKHNALLKAQDVAKRVKSGIVIAADTISVQDNKVFGKPKNMRDARRMLKSLSSSPQWIFTGVAVIDVDSGQTLLDWEKTKVYMDVLNDEEISDYFRKVSPLDKAGSFDIQGKGAFFINRIEGCFYNVVGLPIRKVYRMLKRLDVRLLNLCVCFGSAALCFLFAGCSTEYNIVTQEQESYMYSTEKEVQMGRAIVKQIEEDEEYKLVDDPLIQKRVEDIGKKIAAVCDRKDIEYYFKVIQDDEVNAFALPGGYIYVNSGLIEKVSSDDELAGVLAHEVGHVVARHSIKKLQASQGYMLFRILVAVAPGVGGVGTAADAAFLQIMLGYSREDELLADQLGARYAKRSGYSPQSMILFLRKLQDINRRKPLQELNYFKTHPYVPDRIRAVKEEIGEKTNFSDYINIEQKTHGQ